jgi:hypothetical protein
MMTIAARGRGGKEEEGKSGKEERTSFCGQHSNCNGYHLKDTL